MKQVIDHLNSSSGWVVNSPSTISDNQHINFISGFNEKSIQIRFDSEDTIRTATKTITEIDVTEYETLILSVWSQKKRSFESNYRKSSDFNYKIKLNDTDEFYIPIWNNFTDINIAIDNVTSIDRIEITALHNDTDTIIISEMIAEHEEIPLDILTEAKENIEYYLDKEVSTGILLGTITGNIEDKSITFSSQVNWLDRYSVVYITDGNNSETHQIDDTNNLEFFFNNNFDGEGLQNNYIGANVYLTFPVYINPDQNDVRLPGLAVWGITPTLINRANKLTRRLEGYSVNDDNFIERLEGEILEYTILIDIEARQQELIDIMTRAIRKFIGNEILWINGRLHEITYAGTPTEIMAPQGIDIIPKIQYQIKVEVIENVSDRQTLPKVETINTVVTITDQGGL